MPINGYSIGRDITLTLVTAQGILSVAGITSFQSKQDTNEEKIRRIDGTVDHVRFFDGWSGRFMIERRDATLDQYFSQIEANFYNGIKDGPVSISETITEDNGAISQYRYRGVLLKFEDAGDWTGDKSVKRTLAFIASRRIQLA